MLLTTAHMYVLQAMLDIFTDAAAVDTRRHIRSLLQLSAFLLLPDGIQWGQAGCLQVRPSQHAAEQCSACLGLSHPASPLVHALRFWPCSMWEREPASFCDCVCSLVLRQRPAVQDLPDWLCATLSAGVLISAPPCRAWASRCGASV